MNIRDLFRVADPARLQDNLARMRGTASHIAHANSAAAAAASPVAESVAGAVTPAGSDVAGHMSGASGGVGSLLERIMGSVDRGKFHANMDLMRGSAQSIAASQAARGAAEVAESAASHGVADIAASLLERLGSLHIKGL